MSLTTILIILLIVVIIGGGGYYSGGYYSAYPHYGYGLGIGGLLILVPLILLITGRI